MELTPLRQFIAIARTRHMTRAAYQLGISQPALSAMVRKLEDEVGAPLLSRIGRGIDLTEAGRAFLVHAEDAVRRADAAVRAVRELMGLEHGSIRVGGGATATSYLLPCVVSAVRRAHPGLRFYVREAGSSAVAAAVQSGELDLGIVTLPLKGAQTDDLVRIPLVHDELRIIGLRRKPAKGARTDGFRWSEIADLPVVAFEAGTAVREVLDRAAAAAGVSLNVVMELRSIESIKQMVAAGIGVGFVSRFALKAGEGLACRDGRLSRELAIVRRRDRKPSPAAAVFERILGRTLW
ncbi:MAG: LysR family transcriptional regulator [Phycisphaeraceae bacterium]|nr:LysR family transcriptional regulator [Phycisphaeraceae bacterium]